VSEHTQNKITPGVRTGYDISAQLISYAIMDFRFPIYEITLFPENKSD
jgi:hypothetical protein